MQENKTVGLQSLLESGVHFGHQTRKWDPRMEKYIFTVKDDIHILDLYKSAELLDEAKSFVERIAANGGKLLFVGTKEEFEDMKVDVKKLEFYEELCNMYLCTLILPIYLKEL